MWMVEGVGPLPQFSRRTTVSLVRRERATSTAIVEVYAKVADRAKAGIYQKDSEQLTDATLVWLCSEQTWLVSLLAVASGGREVPAGLIGFTRLPKLRTSVRALAHADRRRRLCRCAAPVFQTPKYTKRITLRPRTVIAAGGGSRPAKASGRLPLPRRSRLLPGGRFRGTHRFFKAQFLGVSNRLMLGYTSPGSQM